MVFTVVDVVGRFVVVVVDFVVVFRTAKALECFFVVIGAGQVVTGTLVVVGNQPELPRGVVIGAGVVQAA